MGVKAFPNLGQWLVGAVFRQEGQQRVADQRQIGQQVGVAAARTVLAHQRIAPPVVADFDPAPVAADEFKPLLVAVFLGWGAGEVVAAFGGGVAGLFDRPLAAQHDQAAGKREVGRQRLDGEGVELADLDPSVGAVGVGKKGVAFKASKA